MKADYLGLEKELNCY